MKKEYPVYFGKEAAGKVCVSREGLYYRFQCRCRGKENTILRLYAACEGKEECLGVVVPEGSGFALDTRLPVSRFGTGEPEFRLETKHTPQRNGTFVPIFPEEPFQYIMRLKESFLVIQNGQKGILIPGE